jgi:hypothetical protein
MGLNKDLKLQANEFSNVATVFFATYLIADIPTGERCTPFELPLRSD